jgi:riboflavin biosynthesis pyrimidine reductase
VIAPILERLYGTTDLGLAPAVLHAAAVCTNAKGGLSVIRVEAPSAPRNSNDRFVLGIARARVDAIITTSTNLRAEPRLLHRLHGDDATAAALRAWSAYDEDARVFILTESGEVPADHRVFSETPRPSLLTGARGAAHAAKLGIEPDLITERAEPSIRDAVGYVLAQSATAVLIETGPSNAAQLYTQPIVVDELMLSVCHERLDDDAIGPELFDADTAEKLCVENNCPAPTGSAGTAGSNWSFCRIAPRQSSAFE